MDYPILPFPTKRHFTEWLEDHHTEARGVWMKIAKKASGIQSITYEEAIDVALMFGWIDGQKKGFDDTYFLQKFTPRGPRSVWSKINTEKVERLIVNGEMRPAGLAAVHAAKKDGRWDAAYHGAKKMEVPEDLAEALKKNKKARDFFETLTGANRYAILYRLHTAKRPETRAKRLQQFIDMLEKGETVH